MCLISTGAFRGSKRSPSGVTDQNVFDIRPGVAIALFIKGAGDIKKTVERADLWGTRQHKYKFLTNNSLDDVKWNVIEPASPSYFFKEGHSLEKEQALDLMFTVGTTALQTSRDEFATAFTESEIRNRLAKLRDPNRPDREFRPLLNKKKSGELPAGDSDFWNLRDARRELMSRRSVKVAPLMYRPFDIRYLIYDDSVVHRMKHEVSDQMKDGNISLLAPRQLSSIEYRHAFVTTSISEMCVVSSSTKEQNRVFPLRRFGEGNAPEENFTSEFRAFLDARYEHHYTPEEILGYIFPSCMRQPTAAATPSPYE